MNSTRPLSAPPSQSALEAGGDWRCVRCGQHWDASRLAAVAAYAAWTVDHDRVGRPPMFDQTRALVVPGPLRRAVLAGDLLGAVAIVLCVPFVILAIGIPIALCGRLLLWMGGLL